jgi:hypothetical protein
MYSSITQQSIGNHSAYLYSLAKSLLAGLRQYLASCQLRSFTLRLCPAGVIWGVVQTEKGYSVKK